MSLDPHTAAADASSRTAGPLSPSEPARERDHPLEVTRRQRRVIVRVVRMAFFILITTVALVTVIQRASDAGSDRPAFTSAPGPAASSGPAPGARQGTGQPSPSASTVPAVEIAWWVPVAIAVGLFGAVLLIDISTPNKKISSISAVIFGLLAGVLATVAISAVIELALRVWLSQAAYVALTPFIDIIKPLLGIALCYLGITTILQTQDDFRLVIPYVEFAKQIRGTKPLVIDTSALIDARIADLAATGLIQAPIIIPRFVIAELQALSDSTDKAKRTRGRRGLEVVTRLQRQGTIDVTIDETPVSSRSVDQMLVELAKTVTGRVVTTDHGLTRVAQIHGVVVLNMHEIAAACKPSLIPGESLLIRLIKPGEQPGQAVGYLDDGTMVVVDHAAELIGADALVLVTSTIQTTGGRMLFGRLASTTTTESTPVMPEGAPSFEPREAARPSDAETQKPDPPAWTEPSAGPVSGASPSTAGGCPPARPGPYPPKPPPRKPPSLRNPRR